MKIVKDFIRQGTIEEFAVFHNLQMVVSERRLPLGDLMRFYAKFEDCDLKGDGVLIGMFGNGPTPEQAIKDYARKISLQTLVKYGNSCKESWIQVWRLI